MKNHCALLQNSIVTELVRYSPSYTGQAQSKQEEQACHMTVGW